MNVAWRKFASKEKKGSKNETLVALIREETAVVATRVGTDVDDQFPVIVDITDVEIVQNFAKFLPSSLSLDFDPEKRSRARLITKFSLDYLLQVS